MTTCVSSIGTSTGLTSVSSGSTYPVAFNSVNNQLFTMFLTSAQSVFFSSNVSRDGIGPFIFTISFISMTTLAVAGTVNITSQITNSSAHLPADTYYVCLRAITSTYTGNISFTFVRYPITAAFKLTSYHGETANLVGLKIAKKPSVCNQPLLWEFIDGQLPKGITLLGNGMLTGTLPYLDCVDDNNNLPPSNNWYYEDETNGISMPWGRQYIFRAKLMLQSDPTTFDIGRFSIAVIADWDKMRDKFDSTYKTIKQDIATGSNPQLVVGLCDIQSLSNTGTNIPVNPIIFADGITKLPNTLTPEQSKTVAETAEANALALVPIAITPEEANAQIVKNNALVVESMTPKVDDQDVVIVENLIADDAAISLDSELIQINDELTTPSLVIQWFTDRFYWTPEKILSMTDEDQQTLLNMRHSPMFNTYVSSFAGLEEYTSNPVEMKMKVDITRIDEILYFTLDEIKDTDVGISVFDMYTTNHHRQALLIPIYLYTKSGEYCQLNLTIGGVI